MGRFLSKYQELIVLRRICKPTNTCSLEHKSWQLQKQNITLTSSQSPNSAVVPLFSRTYTQIFSPSHLTLFSHSFSLHLSLFKLPFYSLPSICTKPELLDLGNHSNKVMHLLIYLTFSFPNFILNFFFLWLSWLRY